MPETFAPAHKYGFKSSVQYNTQVSSMRGGTEKRRSLSAGKHVFELTHNGITDTQADYIADFFDARQGRLTAFYFVDPVTSTTYTVRFDTDDLNLTKVAWNNWEGSTRLIEV